MTDLTEQLYAGTLPTGHYYFNNGVETYIVLYKNINSKHLILQEPEGLTVVSEVPSYEEWKASYNCMFENEVLRLKNTKLKELLESKTLAMNGDTEIVAELQSTVKEYAELWYEANRRICMLTELLVEAKECVEENLEFSKSIGRNRIKPRNKGLLKRIEKALKD